MLKKLIIIATVAAFLAIVSSAGAQKATELYIPIGKSPGLSDKYTFMGTIDDVNYQNGTLSMSHDSNHYTVTITDQTKIYLDKSLMKQSSTYGDMADCRKGMTAEVKFEDNTPGKPAEWIKLQIGQ